LKYVLGLDDGSNLRAELGTTTHKVLEILAIQKKNLQEDKDPFSVDDPALETFKKHKDIFQEANVLSITKSVFDYYKERSEFDFGDTEFKTVTKYVNKALTFKNGIFDPRNLKIVEPETYFEFPIEKDWAKLANGDYLKIRGTMDLTVERFPLVYECIDWKTGQIKDIKNGKLKDFNYFNNDFQLNLYFYALCKKYPEIKQFIITIFYIQFNAPFTMAFDRSNLIKTEEMIHKQMEEIQNCTQPKLLNNWFCDRVCRFRKNGNDTCVRIKNRVLKEGIDKVTLEESVKGHSLDFYQAPGS
jgi:hypothetical protein